MVLEEISRMEAFQEAEDIKNVAILKVELDLKTDTAKENFKKEEENECWTNSVAKQAIIPGKPYAKRKGHTSRPRIMRNMCQANRCKLSCGKRAISEEQRLEIFHYFWNLPNQLAKWDYISHNIELKTPKKRTPGTKRNYTRFYYFRIEGLPIKVCKTMFEATLGISSMWIAKALDIASGKERKRVPARTMKRLCSYKTCRLYCGNRLISEEQRRELFENFWKLPTRVQRWAYIYRNLELTIPDDCSTEYDDKKYHTRRYFFTIDGKRRRVCKTAFVGTLAITDQMVCFVVKKLFGKGISLPDESDDQEVNYFQPSFRDERDMPKFLFVDPDAIPDDIDHTNTNPFN